MSFYNKDEIKQALTVEQIVDILNTWHGEPKIQNGVIVSKTVCHHSIDELDEAGYKLYYYPNTQLFRCYTGCEEPIFDIFELCIKVFNNQNKQNITLLKAISYVAQYFGFAAQEEEDGFNIEQPWEKVFNKYDRIKNIEKETQRVELKVYNDSILDYLPHPHIVDWHDEGISYNVMQSHGIAYDPVSQSVIIPHYDINNNLVGIRGRAFIADNEVYGKYRPARLGSPPQLYNHPLGFNLYNINWSKDNIARMRQAIVLEGEKSCLQFASYFGEQNDITVAVCGSNLINYQAKLLIDLGVDEIIIGLDKQYQEIGDSEFKKLVKNLKQIHKKYGHYVKISFIFDKENILPYKASPTDLGPVVFQELFKKRVTLYES